MSNADGYDGYGEDDGWGDGYDGYELDPEMDNAEDAFGDMEHDEAEIEDES